MLGIVAAALAGCAGPARTSAARPALGANTLNVAETALAGNRPDLALHVADAVLKLDPGNVRARLIHGDAAYLLGDCQTATRDYTALLGAAPHDARAEIGLGRCALRGGGRGAVTAFRRATRDDPHNAVAFNDLGVALSQRGAFAAAAPAFRRALALRPNFRAARANLGLALALGGNAGAGAAIIAPLAQGGPISAPERADYAAALALSGHHGAARQVLDATMPAAEADAVETRMARLAARPAAGAKRAVN
jgi:Flp pilus assembly protein TadD